MVSKLAISALVLLLLPAAAHAGTVSRNGGSLVFAAAPGEANNLVVSGVDKYSFTDLGATPTAGSGCTMVGTRVTCDGAGVTEITIQLSDGDDQASAHLRVPVSIDGGDGNDALKAGLADDLIAGGNGNDTLDGFGGADRYVGGAGDDTINTVGGGTDTLDCTGGGTDRVQRDDADKLANCPGPGASLSIPHVPKLRKFLKSGMRFSINCPVPCSIGWQLVAADHRTLRHVKRISGFLSGRVPRLDRDAYPILDPPGAHGFTATAIGKATKKSLGKLRKIKVKLTVVVADSASAEQTLTRKLTIRR